jgi:hypothetical protein
VDGERTGCLVACYEGHVLEFAQVVCNLLWLSIGCFVDMGVSAVFRRAAAHRAYMFAVPGNAFGG